MMNLIKRFNSLPKGSHLPEPWWERSVDSQLISVAIIAIPNATKVFKYQICSFRMWPFSWKGSELSKSLFFRSLPACLHIGNGWWKVLGSLQQVVTIYRGPYFDAHQSFRPLCNLCSRNITLFRKKRNVSGSSFVPSWHFIFLCAAFALFRNSKKPLKKIGMLFKSVVVMELSSVAQTDKAALS